MKKVLLIIMLMVSNLLAFAQDIYLDIESYPTNQTLCYGAGQHVYVNAQPECQGFGWIIDGQPVGDLSPIIINPEIGNHTIEYFGCDEFYHFFRVIYKNAPVPNGWTKFMWKMPGTTIQLEAIGSDSLDNYTPTWQVGPPNNHNRIYDASEPGTYPVEISSPCGTTMRTFIVRDNVEIMSASVDPNTNKNLVTWETSPEQAEYISNVIINRDGVDMATVPYTDGQYLDNIGSDLAARVYTLRGVCPDGTQCPFPSRRRGTIHMAFLPDINGNVEMTWNQPILDGAPIHVNRFEICEFNPNSNEISVIDFVSSVTTSYSCNQSMFDYGYPLIRAVIEDGRGEKDMLSNRTEDLVGLNEMETGTLRVYPNPSNGVFNIEGEGTLHIVNVLGQEVMSKEIDGKTTIELPQGMYFVKLGGVTRKVVVE